MDVSCLMLATNVPDRMRLVERNIASIEAANNGLLGTKILSIDILDQHPKDMSVFRKYENLGWRLVVGKCSGRRGMLNNILRGLGNVPASDFIFYVEDDILIDRLPTKRSLKCADEFGLGFICFNTHIHCLDKPRSPFKEAFINDKKNYKSLGGELFLVKQPQLKDEYYLNFPSAIVKHNVFTTLFNHASKRCSGIGLEPGMTETWFSIGLSQKYGVGVYVKPDTLSHIPMGLDAFYHMANMQFWNNGYKNPTINRDNTLF